MSGRSLATHQALGHASSKCYHARCTCVGATHLGKEYGLHATSTIASFANIHMGACSQNPATQNRTRDHLIAVALYKQMLYQLSYSRK